MRQPGARRWCILENENQSTSRRRESAHDDVTPSREFRVRCAPKFPTRLSTFPGRIDSEIRVLDKATRKSLQTSKFELSPSLVQLIGTPEKICERGIARDTRCATIGTVQEISNEISGFLHHGILLNPRPYANREGHTSGKQISDHRIEAEGEVSRPSDRSLPEKPQMNCTAPRLRKT